MGTKQLLAESYEELRGIARRCLARRWQRTDLQATLVVNEAYLRLAKRDPSDVDREQIVALAVREIECVLLDHARAQRTAKRGGGWGEVPLDDSLLVGVQQMAETLALDEVLARLAREHAEWHEVVELRFGRGLATGEIARSLDVTPQTVRRRWKKARAWLRRELSRE